MALGPWTDEEQGLFVKAHGQVRQWPSREQGSRRKQKMTKGEEKRGQFSCFLYPLVVEVGESRNQKWQ